MMMLLTQTRERFLVAIAAQVPAEGIAEIHFFQPMKQGGVESGVAVVVGPRRRRRGADCRLHRALSSYAQGPRPRQVGDQRRRRGGRAARDGRCCRARRAAPGGRRRRRDAHGRRRASRACWRRVPALRANRRLSFPSDARDLDGRRVGSGVALIPRSGRARHDTSEISLPSSRVDDRSQIRSIPAAGAPPRRTSRTARSRRGRQLTHLGFIRSGGRQTPCDSKRREFTVEFLTS